MAVMEILDKDNPCLRRQADRVEEITPEIRKLVRDMYETMYKAPGVGLAAPQVGVCRQIVVIDVGDGKITLINPEIIESKGEDTDEEGCLSVPGLVASVSRASEVRVRAQDIKGRFFEVSGRGLLARALQHEIDHLRGTLFIDRADLLTLRKRTDGS